MVKAIVNLQILSPTILSESNGSGVIAEYNKVGEGWNEGK